MRPVLFAMARVGLACLTFTAAAAAQTPPPDGGDLTVPPELRQAAHPGSPASVAAPRARRAVPDRRLAGRRDGGSPVRAPAPRPVDFGLVVRGGSSTPRLVSPLGGSEAVQESGTAIGAGMRFGF